MLILIRTDPNPPPTHPHCINLSQIVPVCIKCIPSLLKNSKQAKDNCKSHTRFESFKDKHAMETFHVVNSYIKQHRRNTLCSLSIQV